MIPGAPIRPKDFTLIKKDGYYHLFFIRNNVTLTPGATERDFGHAISADLYHWEQLPPVMGVDTTGWDSLHVWAPSVVERDGLYWMFYTGVGRLPGISDQAQRIGLAVSADLMTWTRVGGPIFDGSQVPWAWWSSQNPTPAFRDPFVMPEPNKRASWLMYYTASYAPDSTATVVGVARIAAIFPSSTDFTRWSDLKPLLVTWRNYTFNPLTESPHLFEHAGLWYLIITTSAGQPLTFYTSPNPTGELVDWTYRGRMRNMLGYDTSTWFASEYLRDGTHEYFCFISGDRVELREILWGSSWTFSLLQPPLFHVIRADWVAPEVCAADTARLRVVCANPFSGVPQFVTYLVDSLGDETAVPAESLGFLPSPAMTADTTDVSWLARRFPAVPDSDTTTVTRLRLRLADGTLAVGLLTIRAPRAAPPDTVPILPAPAVHEAVDPQDLLWRHRAIRSLSGTPMGDGPAVAVKLDAPAAARVDIYDLAGRRLRNLAWRELPKGVTVLPWDGRDDAGRTLQRGVYFARLLVGGRSSAARVLLAP